MGWGGVVLEDCIHVQSERTAKLHLQVPLKLSGVERVIVPVNCDNNHWTCAVADIPNKRLVYYDSCLVGPWCGCGWGWGETGEG